MVSRPPTTDLRASARWLWGSAGDKIRRRSAIDGRQRRARTRRARRSSAGPPPDGAGRACGRSKRAGVTAADIDVFVPHQANLRIIDAHRQAAARRRPDDMVVADDIVVLRQHVRGVHPAGAGPHAASTARCAPGDTVLLVGFGAGLTYAGQVVVCP